MFLAPVEGGDTNRDGKEKEPWTNPFSRTSRSSVDARGATSRMLEGVLATEEEHADDLRNVIETLGKGERQPSHS